MTLTAQLDYASWATEQRARIERALNQALPLAVVAPTTLHEAMRYSTLGGGKRIRALLAYSAADTCGAEMDALDAVASAVEMIHAYSLIHDDLPCMDDDVLRRGQPTCHIKFGEAVALLAGDALQPLAFELLVNAPLSDNTRVKLVTLLAEASGSAGMAGGQAIDLASTGNQLPISELQTMHRMKTGALIRASVLMGIACGSTSSTDWRGVTEYADALGLAFQVVDDILDAEGDALSLGKSAGKDAAQNKPTYVTTLGIAAAKAHAESLTDAAHAALAPLGTRAQRLHDLADEILRRRY